MVGQAVYNDLMQKQTAAENFIEQCEKLGKPLRFTSDTCDSVNVFSKFNRTGRTTLTHVAELLEPFELYGAIQLDWRVTLADEACYCFVCAGVKTECGGCRVLFLADIPAPLKRGQYLGYNVAYINGEMVRADGNAGYGEVHTSYVHTTTIEQLAAL